MPAACSHRLGLGFGLSGPLVLNVVTAPAERIKLLLQTQDEIILNLREESLAAHHSHNHNNHNDHQNNQTLSEPLHDSVKGYNVNSGTEGEVKEEEEEEPRSIIVPYAQLPYKDMQDCAERLIEKEGPLSLWRGYSLECTRLALQTGIETVLHRKQFGYLFDIRRLLFSSSSYSSSSSSLCINSFTGSTAWILGAAVEGTAVSSVALLAVYPLAVLQTKMAVDVIRRTRSVKKVPSVAPVAPAVTVASPAHASTVMADSRDSAEWVQHNDGEYGSQESLSAAESTTPETLLSSSSSSPSSVQEYEYTLSYKYRNARETFKAILESSEGYLGFYKGFSTVVISTFVSRIGFLTLYRTLSPLLLNRSSPGLGSTSSSSRGLGAFLLVFGATSIVNLIVYPLSTVCHRRMVAAPGRYSSSWDAGKQIVEKQGWKALYKGVEVAMVRSAVMAVLSGMFY
ncbi:hypothetical protein BGX21_005545 [Mortierella sp. AD011]|nr:hypothetical protein BGX21_005545 [Mortierella sp. AD011]